MRWLSESVETLITEELVEPDGQPKIHDRVVVGSGYGGAVAALRLAEKKNKVLVLERGGEYLPGEFPNDIANLPSHVRVERWNTEEPQGYEDGLFDLRVGRNVGVLVGNALGGTSQINANVAIEPERRVFAKQAWPREIRREGGFDRYFEQARRSLAVTPWHQGGSWPLEKHAALARLCRELEADGGLEVAFESPSITVTLDKPTEGHHKDVPSEGCVKCGDCVTGCNYFAKNTLTSTYLANAKAWGARMFTGVTVLKVGRRADSDPWEITFVRTAQRGDLRRREKRERDRDASDCCSGKAPAEGSFTHVLYAENVILSAGSLGSTEILHRSKASGLSVSRSLGRRFSGNGDYLAFGYMQSDRVSAVGRGSRARAPGNPDVGPTITGAIHIADRRTQRLEDCTVIEEGSVPGALAGIFHEMVTTMSSVTQLSSDTYRGEGDAGVDHLALRPEGLTHTQTLLAMGHDSAEGRLAYGEGRIQIEWDRLEDEQVYRLHDERLRKIERLGAIYLGNPAWSPLPESVTGVLSGPALGNGMFSVHPLGGCPMGDDATKGVVDHVGRVYKADSGSHPGLYVLDGSIIPCALGVNPLLTITALAERAMEEITKAEAIADPAPPLTGFPRDELPNPPYQNPRGDRVMLNFAEVLRGEVAYRKPGERKETRNAVLMLHLPIKDLHEFFRDSSHTIEIRGAQGEGLDGLPARLCIASETGGKPGRAEEYEVVQGTVRIFQPSAKSILCRIAACARVALTWLIERGCEEVVRKLLGRESSDVGVRQQIGDWLKMVGHAAEERIFLYDLRLKREGSYYQLRGTKKFAYAASWGALIAYAIKRLLFLLMLKKPYLHKRNVWISLGQLDIELRDCKSGCRIAKGRLFMDMLDMTRRYAAQIGPWRDTASALIAFAGYPLLFLRAMIKMRLWDFRLPDYPKRVPPELDPDEGPVPPAGEDAATRWPKFPPLRTGDVHPERSVALQVRRSARDAREITVKLTRYRQKGRLDRRLTAQGIHRVKSIVLVNGFAQPTLAFVAQEIRPNLAEFFHEKGYEVWLFDYRTSTILDASKEPCTMDDIAEYDIPCAVDEILGTLRAELGLQADDKIQIYAFAHCVGAACMAMSMLAGKLQHPDGESKIAGVILSQMQALLVGGETSQMRIQVGAIMRDLAGIQYLRLSAAERRPSAFESLLDRVYATLPVADEERCPHENSRIDDRPDIATCKRMTGTISRLLKHDRLHPKTHERLPVYFGRANTSLLVHGTKCLDYERLVNADGQNVYVTYDNIRRYFRLPVALLHGSDNVLFDVESLARTSAELTRVNPEEADRGYYECIRAQGYAHFDCTVGEYAPRDIFPRLGGFLDRAWTLDKVPEGAAGVSGNEEEWAGWASRARAPLAGPIIGRVERDPKDATAKVRVWMQVDESASDTALCAMTLRKARGSQAEPVVQAWPVIRIALEPGGERIVTTKPVAGGVGHVAIAIADLVLPSGASDAPEGYEFEFVSVHAFPLEGNPGRPPGSIIPEPADADHVPSDAPGLGRDSPIDDSRWFDDETGPALDQAPPAVSEPDEWMGQIQGALRRQIRQAGEIGAEDARKLIETMTVVCQRTRNTALAAKPGTISRRRRDLPREHTSTVHIQRATLIGPSPAGSLRFLAGCCRFPGNEFEAVRADRTFRHINENVLTQDARPDFMFMLGDQIYADATAGLFDPRSPVEKFSVRYQEAFSTPQFRRVAAQLPLYMVIDDHEIDNDWSGDKMEGDVDAMRLFNTAISSFAAYQWSHSPRSGSRSAPGFNYRFEAGGYRFFVLDTRTQRKRGEGQQVLAPSQIVELGKWLDEETDDRRPRFIVSGSVLAPGERRADLSLSDLSVDSWQLSQEDRRGVLGLVIDRPNLNVVFLSGDYHCAATATLEVGGKPRAYAVVSPPLYAPYVYANAQACEVMRSESIRVGSVDVVVNAQPCEGNGFSDIRISPTPQGGWSLDVYTWVLRFEDEEPRFELCTRSFPMS